jgi:hypothetical protein
MAQFPFQHAILKIESKKKERVLRGALFFLPDPPMPKPAPAAAMQADISVLRRQITDLVAQNAVAMVQHAIDAVNEEGQYQAIKYLFEMVGLYPAQADDESPVDDSLVKTLLHQLGLPETTPLESEQEFTASNLLK